jgi:hypothetical protein
MVYVLLWFSVALECFSLPEHECFVSGKFCSSVAKYFMVYSSGRMCWLVNMTRSNLFANVFQFKKRFQICLSKRSSSNPAQAWAISRRLASRRRRRRFVPSPRTTHRPHRGRSPPWRTRGPPARRARGAGAARGHDSGAGHADATIITACWQEAWPQYARRQGQRWPEGGGALTLFSIWLLTFTFTP